MMRKMMGEIASTLREDKHSSGCKSSGSIRREKCGQPVAAIGY